MPLGLSGLLQRVLQDYGTARQGPTGNSSLWKERGALEADLQSLDALAKRPTLRAKLSFGKGGWVAVPFLAILDERETNTPQDGVYPVYLFRQDLGGVYLTFNQGVTKTRKDLGAKEFEQEMAKRKAKLRTFCAGLESRGFKLDDHLDLGGDASLGKQYEVSTVAYKFYDAAALPTEADLTKDLDAMLGAYDTYLAQKPKGASGQDTTGQVEASPRWRAIQVGLDCQPFVLLAGPTGTGKTQAARRLKDLEGVGLAIVDVHGGWVDSASAFGYLNPLTARFVPGPVLLGLLDATRAARPILVLDEINVSPPHIYLAPLLAALERAFAGDKAEPLVVYQDAIATEDALRAAAAMHPALRVEQAGPFARLVLDVPATLRVIGTLNFDGSTEDLAPKLLSRSFVVWFEAPVVQRNLELVARSAYATKSANLGEALQALQAAGIPVSPRSVVRARVVIAKHKGVVGLEDILLSGLILPQVQSLTEDQVRVMQEQPLLDALPEGFCRGRLMRMMEHARTDGFANLWLVA